MTNKPPRLPQRPTQIGIAIYVVALVLAYGYTHGWFHGLTIGGAQ